jgi:hypothetical protein
MTTQHPISDPALLKPGKYIRTWAGKSLPVQIVKLGSGLREVTPSGSFWLLDTLAASGAVWQRVEDGK